MTTTRRLRWSNTVERESVHRTSVAEVLLTDALACGPRSFAVAAQWPRSHPTFPHAVGGRHNPLMVAETLRQIGIHIPLRYFPVPEDAHFLIQDLFLAVDPAAEPAPGHGATDVTCAVTADTVRFAAGGRRVTGMRLRVRFSAEGRVFARACGNVRFLLPRAYTAFRGPEREPEPRRARHRPRPREVAVPAVRDVLLTVEEGRLHIAPTDPMHPFFFDHRADHVPGMVLLEAARQAAALVSGGRLLRPVAYRLRALRFTELSPSAHVECGWAGDGRASFRVWQDGERTAAGALRYGCSRDHKD